MPDISDISSSLENLERELSKLRSASRLIHDAEVLISQNIDVTQKLSANLAEETKKTQDFIINNMTKTREISETLVKKVSKSSAMVMSEAKKAVDLAVKDSISVQQASMKLVEGVHDLINTINEYKIPFHFQQLDTDISKVDTKIDDLQIRVTSLEKSIMDRIESKVELVSGRIKKTVTIRYVVLFLILLVSVSLLILQLFGY
jgi:hypothetical protein